MSDTCYELFKANIEGAHAFIRKSRLDLAIARFNTSKRYTSVLCKMHYNFKIMNNLFKHALNTKPHTIPTVSNISIDKQNQILRDAMNLLKEIAKDCIKFRQDLAELTQKWLFGRILNHIIMGRLPDKLSNNIEDLYVVIESHLEEEGEYVTAEELLRSLY